MNTLISYEHIGDNFSIVYKNRANKIIRIVVDKSLIYNGSSITTENDIKVLIELYLSNPSMQAKLLVESVSLVDGSIEIIGEENSVKPRSFPVSSLNETPVLGTDKTEIEIYNNLKAFVAAAGLGELSSMIVPFKKGRVKINTTWFEYLNVLAISGTILTDSTALVVSLFNKPEVEE